MTPRSLAPRVLAVLATAALSFVSGRLASADPPAITTQPLHGSDEENYWLKIPPGWTWGRPSDFEKYGAKEVAERRIEKLPNNGEPVKLPNGTVVTGCGGRTILTRQDIPKDVALPKEIADEYESTLVELQVLDIKARQLVETTGEDVPEALDNQIKEVRKKVAAGLEAICKLDKVQDILRSRYGKNPPTIEIDTGDLGGVPAGEIKAEGTAPNLAGEDAPCTGHMLVCVVRNKLWRMCTWTWMTSRLRTILITDQDQLEMQFAMPKIAAIPKKPVEVIAAGSSNDPAADPDANSEHPVTAIDRECKIFKPKGWVSKSNQQIDRSKAFERELCFQLSRRDRTGNEAIVSVSAWHMQGGTSPFDADKHMETTWRDFQVNHAKGPIKTFPFLRITEKAKFLTLPDFTKPKEIERTLDKDGKPETVKRSRLDELGVVEEAKAVVLGKEKVRMTWRLSLDGILDRFGQETAIQYIFATQNWAYVMYVTFRKDGQKAWAAETQKILSSFELEPPK